MCGVASISIVWRITVLTCMFAIFRWATLSQIMDRECDTLGSFTEARTHSSGRATTAARWLVARSCSSSHNDCYRSLLILVKLVHFTLLQSTCDMRYNIFMIYLHLFNISTLHIIFVIVVYLSWEHTSNYPTNIVCFFNLVMRNIETVLVGWRWSVSVVIPYEGGLKSNWE